MSGVNALSVISKNNHNSINFIHYQKDTCTYLLQTVSV